MQDVDRGQFEAPDAIDANGFAPLRQEFFDLSRAVSRKFGSSEGEKLIASQKISYLGKRLLLLSPRERKQAGFYITVTGPTNNLNVIEPDLPLEAFNLKIMLSMDVGKTSLNLPVAFGEVVKVLTFDGIPLQDAETLTLSRLKEAEITRSELPLDRLNRHAGQLDRINWMIAQGKIAQKEEASDNQQGLAVHERHVDSEEALRYSSLKHAIILAYVHTISSVQREYPHAHLAGKTNLIDVTWSKRYSDTNKNHVDLEYAHLWDLGALVGHIRQEKRTSINMIELLKMAQAGDKTAGKLHALLIRLANANEAERTGRAHRF